MKRAVLRSGTAATSWPPAYSPAALSSGTVLSRGDRRSLAQVGAERELHRLGDELRQPLGLADDQSLVGDPHDAAGHRVLQGRRQPGGLLWPARDPA